WILIGIVLISGFSQGMLLPTIAIIFEQHGLSSSINGIHATALYIGILVASPFMEKPMMKIGYKPFIITGGILVFTSLFAFSLWDSIIFWFILRMIVGIGDQMLHFGSQTWITTTVSEKSRGRSVAFYGLSFCLGFAVVLIMSRLVSIYETLPCIVSSALSLLMWLLLFLEQNDRPKSSDDRIKSVSSMIPFKHTLQCAYLSMLPAFTHGNI